MREFLDGVLGTYNPVTYETVVGDQTVEVVAYGLAGVDWSYVFSGILFVLSIYCVLRAIGGFICKDF